MFVFQRLSKLNTVDIKNIELPDGHTNQQNSFSSGDPPQPRTKPIVNGFEYKFIFDAQWFIINTKMKSFANLDDRIFEEHEEEIKARNASQGAMEREDRSEDDAYEGEETEKEKKKKCKHQKRKNASYSKWMETDKKKFWLKNLEEMSKFPQKMHSWNHWKPDRYFHDMAKYLKTKTSSQCKSFDQRMKNHFFLNDKRKPLDLPEATLISLEPYALEDQELLRKLLKFREVLEGRRQVKMEASSPEEIDNINNELQETTELKILQNDYIRAVKECIEYYNGEGAKKLTQLKKKFEKVSP